MGTWPPRGLLAPLSQDAVHVAGGNAHEAMHGHAGQPVEAPLAQLGVQLEPMICHTAASIDDAWTQPSIAVGRRYAANHSKTDCGGAGWPMHGHRMSCGARV